MKKTTYLMAVMLLICLTVLLGTCVKRTTDINDIPQWEEAPAMTIDQSKIYLATIETEIGNIKFEMFAGKTPVTVNNFISLAREGFYNNSYFHRVLPDFIAQAGKSTGGVHPGPGYSIAKEIVEELSFDEPGYVAMTRPNIFNNNASQFFISLSRATWSDGRFTIFGKVLAGMDVARALSPRELEDDPGKGTLIKTIRISESDTSLLPPKTAFKPNPPVLVSGRPLATMAARDRDFLYNQKPGMIIDPARTYTARIETPAGIIDVTLRPDIAPDSVNNFYILANLGFYDNMSFSNVIPSRIVVGGSPKGQLYSDSGYAIPAESSSELPFGKGKMGYVAYPSLDGSSSGSIFYLSMTNDNMPQGHYVTVFGEISAAGMEVLAAIPADDQVTDYVVEQARVIRIDVIEE